MINAKISQTVSGLCTLSLYNPLSLPNHNYLLLIDYDQCRQSEDTTAI